MQLFRAVWTASIWPTIKDKHAALLKERPAKQDLENDSATGGHFGPGVLQKAAEQGECRNISANLAWTDPTENTPMQLSISFEAVAQWTLDTYTDANAVDVEDPDSKLADNADGDPVAASASDPVLGLSRAELLLANKKSLGRFPRWSPAATTSQSQFTARMSFLITVSSSAWASMSL